MTLKINQIIKHKDGSERKVLGICGEAIILDGPVNNTWSNQIATEQQLLANGYIIPQEAWEPKIDENYWYLDWSGVSFTEWRGDAVDKGRRVNMGIFKSESEAEKALEEIKIKLGK